MKYFLVNFNKLIEELNNLLKLFHSARKSLSVLSMAIVLGTLIIAGCSNTSGCFPCYESYRNWDHTPSNSYYWNLPLHTPSAAAKTFLSAMNNRDYLTAYLILSLKFHKGWRRAITQVSIPEFLGTPASTLEEVYPTMQKMFNNLEHRMGWYHFERFMSVALNSGELDVRFFNAEKVSINCHNTDADTAKVTFNGPDDRSTSCFLVKSPHGRWRVNRIEQMKNKQKYVWPVYSSVMSNEILEEQEE